MKIINNLIYFFILFVQRESVIPISKSSVVNIVKVICSGVNYKKCKENLYKLRFIFYMNYIFNLNPF